jgi:selenium metabolism protein YedF
MADDIDLRGLSCPEPVVRTKKVLDVMQEGTFRVTVDNSAARDNVKRFAESQGCTVKIEEREGDFVVEISKSSACAPLHEVNRMPLTVTAYVESDTMGRGSEDLGRILMRAFLKTVPDIEPKISRIIFINNGVKLTSEGSELIETLKALENKGISIFSCGTCLDFFHLLDKVKVGKVSNMFEIVTMLAGSDRIVKP